MRMRITAVAALAGSLFLAPAIMGQANAGVPDTKGAFGTIEGDVTLVGRGGGRGGGGGMGRGGGGGRHIGGGGGGRHYGGGGGGRHYGGGGGGVTTAAAVAGVTTAAAVTGVMLMEVAGDTTVEVANIMAMVVGRIMPIEAIEITATTVDIAVTVTMAGMAHLSSLMALTAITLVDADGYIATL